MVKLRAHASIPSRSSQGKVVLSATVVMMAAGLAFLSVVASGQVYTDLDLRVSQWVQALSIPGLDFLSAIVNFLTDAPMAITLWLIVTAFFVLRGRPLEAIAVFSISGLWFINQFVGMAVDRPAPTSVMTEVSRAESGGFPSGHVTGAVVFYGVLIFLTFSNLRRSNLRIILPAVAVTIVGLTSLSRV